MKKICSYSIAIVLLAYAHLSYADDLRIAVASNFYPTANLIKQHFEKNLPDKLILIRGSTGKLFAQIKHGAPYDVFLAADIERPQILEKQKLIIPGSRTSYAIGQLALWSKNKTRNAIEILKTNQFRKLAIANPKTAPYGRAAIETLQQLKIYPQVKAKLVYGENIAQAFQFVQSGSADIGFVALPHVKSLNDNYWLPAANSHHRLEQQMVILASTKNPELAKTFANYMQTEVIKQLIREQGYKTL